MKGDSASVAGGGIGEDGGGGLQQARDQPAELLLWKKKYAGLGLSELRELRQLGEENGKLHILRYAHHRDPQEGLRRCGQERDCYETRTFMELVEITEEKPTYHYRFECWVSRI